MPIPGERITAARLLAGSTWLRQDDVNRSIAELAEQVTALPPAQEHLPSFEPGGAFVPLGLDPYCHAVPDLEQMPDRKFE